MMKKYLCLFICLWLSTENKALANSGRMTASPMFNTVLCIHAILYYVRYVKLFIIPCDGWTSERNVDEKSHKNTVENNLLLPMKSIVRCREDYVVINV